MASSCDRLVPNGEFFSIPPSTQRSQNLATSPIYWDTELYSELSLNCDLAIPSETSPSSIYLPPKAYSLPEFNQSTIKTDEALDSQSYSSFVHWGDAAKNMDLSSSHIFTELELETAFSSAMTDLDTQTNPIPSRVRPTDTMMSDTIHAPALIFGGDFVAEELLFETPTANTLPVTEIQSRRIFYDAPAQQPSYMVPYAGGPVTRGTTKAFKIGISPTQETKLHNIAMPSNSYTTPLPSPASSDSSPPAATQPNRRKRKLADFDDEDESSPKTKGYQARNHAPIKKTAHSLIEQRYRTNLNDKIAALRDCVPRLGVMSSAETASEVKKGKGDAAEDFQGLSPTHKLNKATVLSKAAEFILHLDKRNKALCKENIAYKNRIKAFEILMLTTKNSDATTIMTTNTAPTLATSPPSSGSSRSGNCSFDSTSKVTSLTEGRINDVGNGEDAEREANMRMSEKEEVLKYELDAATANYMPFTASRRVGYDHKADPHGRESPTSS